VSSNLILDIPVNRSGSPNSKRMHKGLKPPDLWIHGNVELSEMEHIDPDDISEVESATIGHRRMRSTNDKGFYMITKDTNKFLL